MNYSDLLENNFECKGEILDLKLFDIPATMHRNIRACAELGARAVTVADSPLNIQGIDAALEAGRLYRIEIIIGDPEDYVL